MNIGALLESSMQKIRQYYAQTGNPEGQLFGEVVVFTGTLSLNRRVAAELQVAPVAR